MKKLVSKNTFILLTVFLLLAVIDFPRQDISLAFVSPQASFYSWLGHSPLGESMLSLIFWGSLQTFFIALLGRLLAMLLSIGGFCLAMLAPRIVEDFLMRLSEAIMTIPSLLFALALGFALGGGFFSMVLTIGLSEWSINQKWLLNRLSQLRRLAFIEVSKTYGATKRHLLSYHLKPFLLGDAKLLFKLYLPASVLSVASLEFLGLSGFSVVSGLGLQIAAYKDYFFIYPHTVIAPLTALMAILFFISRQQEQPENLTG